MDNLTRALKAGVRFTLWLDPTSGATITKAFVVEPEPRELFEQTTPPDLLTECEQLETAARAALRVVAESGVAQ